MSTKLNRLFGMLDSVNVFISGYIWDCASQHWRSACRNFVRLQASREALCSFRFVKIRSWILLLAFVWVQGLLCPTSPIRNEDSHHCVYCLQTILQKHFCLDLRALQVFNRSLCHPALRLNLCIPFKALQSVIACKIEFLFLAHFH